MDGKGYIKLVKKGASHLDGKIRDDTFRTFKNDPLFWSVVQESSMARVLNAFTWYHDNEIMSQKASSTPGESASSGADSTVGYVQGLNVILAPFLFVMPELDAFTAFAVLVCRHCPRYALSVNLVGSHHACSLVDRLLNHIDPELYKHITSKILRTEIFAFPYMTTLMACMQPLSEVIKLWDAILAFGCHFCVLLFTAHVVLLRTRLLVEDSAYKLQRELTPSQNLLNADKLIKAAIAMIPYVPSDFYEELICHPVEKPTFEAVTKKQLSRYTV